MLRVADDLAALTKRHLVIKATRNIYVLLYTLYIYFTLLRLSFLSEIYIYIYILMKLLIEKCLWCEAHAWVDANCDTCLWEEVAESRELDTDYEDDFWNEYESIDDDVD